MKIQTTKHSRMFPLLLRWHKKNLSRYQHQSTLSIEESQKYLDSFGLTAEVLDKMTDSLVKSCEKSNSFFEFEINYIVEIYQKYPNPLDMLTANGRIKALARDYKKMEKEIYALLKSELQNAKILDSNQESM